MKTLKKLLIYPMACLMFLLLGEANVSFAMTAEELKAELDSKTNLTIIDIRGNSFYQGGHIPSAINIPALLLTKKRLPPLGKVVVYGDGIDLELVDTAVAALNEKKGIEAEALEGGIFSWEDLRQPITYKQGLTKEWLNYVPLPKFKRLIANNSAAVLVDLRSSTKSITDLSSLLFEVQQEGKQGEQFSKQGSSFSSKAQRRIIGLSQEEKQEIEGIVSTKSSVKNGAANNTKNATGKDSKSSSSIGNQNLETPILLKKRNQNLIARTTSALLQQKSKDNPNELYILIDDGSGRSEMMARRLRAAGIRRVVILVGGEQSLSSKGRSVTVVNK